MAALLQRQFAILSVGTALLFLLTGFLAINGNRAVLSSSTIQLAVSEISTVTFLQLMGREIPLLSEKVQAPAGGEGNSISHSVFQVLTGIAPGDLHAVIGRELPGMLALEQSGLKTPEAAEDPAIAYTESAAPFGAGETAPPADSADGENPPETGKPPDAGGSKRAKKDVVFVYNTHNRESWLDVAERKTGSSAVDHPTQNISLVGKHLAEVLNDRGIGTQFSGHDIYQELLDQGKSYGLSYAQSLKVITAATKQNRDLHYFFDIHRDASPRDKTTVTINGKTYARLMFVVGTRNENYRENHKFASELNALLEKKYPGLSRGLDDKGENEGNGEYNQHVSPGSILIEVGGTENNLQECKNAIEAFAEVFADYYWQAERVSAPASPAANEG
ncbi:stage II sporulation protein P [Brevibacillus sp. B_LB10_24]|uniref:stage II sporulation protein P n=1 Tax=Brevibacillus sp. B_LB10_24 TaxID=3380645 RepID=UPI0038BB5B6E